MSCILIIAAMLKLARVALASMLLVGVPMVDAVACAREDAHTAVEQDLHVDAEVLTLSVDAERPDHDTSPGGDAQHCVHGHCHHSTPFRDMADNEVSLIFESSRAVLPFAGSAVLKHVPLALDRPPKA
jgi:hypothetical protein